MAIDNETWSNYVTRAEEQRSRSSRKGRPTSGVATRDPQEREDLDTEWSTGSDSLAHGPQTPEPPQQDPRRLRRDRYPQAFGKRLSVKQLLARWPGVERLYLESLAIDGDLTPYMNGWPVDIDQADRRGAFRFLVDIEGPGTTAHRWQTGLQGTLVEGNLLAFPELPDEANYDLTAVLAWEDNHPALRMPAQQYEPRKRGRPMTYDPDLIDKLIQEAIVEEKRPTLKNITLAVCERYVTQRPDDPPPSLDGVVRNRVRQFFKKAEIG